MRFFHLSDLHIGKRLHDVSLLEDQQYILGQILTLAQEHRPDAVVLAGDIYDKTVPSAEAVTVFDDFLYQLARQKLPVLIISGNHDSPERLSFGGRLMGLSGIHFSPVYDGQIKSVVLHDEHGPVRFWLLPFIKPQQVRRYFPDADIESYTDALRTALAQQPPEQGVRNVLVTHQFVTGATVCDSEELSVGGSDNVDASVFEDFDYVALGHIHGPQNVGSNRIRYCGTPLKYSFSEAEHHKSVTLVELGTAGSLHLEVLPLQPLRELQVLRGSFELLTDSAFYATQDRNAYVHILLTDEEDVPEAAGRLRTVYPNLLHLSYDNTRTRTNRILEGPMDPQSRSPLSLIEEFYQQQNNQPLSDTQRNYLQALIESIWEDEK